ncbi:MAG: hypothetical protein ACYCSW_11210 [bacterium]
MDIKKNYKEIRDFSKKKFANIKKAYRERKSPWFLDLGRPLRELKTKG